MIVCRAFNENDRDPTFTKAQMESKLKKSTEEAVASELAGKVDQHRRALVAGYETWTQTCFGKWWRGDAPDMPLCVEECIGNDTTKPHSSVVIDAFDSWMRIQKVCTATALLQAYFPTAVQVVGST